MNVLEKEIEDIVWGADIDALRKRGFPMPNGLRYRQLGLGDYGIADIVVISMHKSRSRYSARECYVERKIKATVIELKKDEVNIDTYMQAARYCKGIERYIIDANESQDDFLFEFEIILVGKTISTSGSFCFLPDIIPNLRVLTYGIDLENGVRFYRQQGYHIIDGSLANIDAKRSFRELTQIQSYNFDNYATEVLSPGLENTKEA